MPPSPEVATPLDKARPWINRAVWAIQVVAVGLAIGSALASHSRPVQIVGTVLAWLIWTIGLGAVIVAHPMGLTAIRFCLTALGGAAVWLASSSDVPLWQRGLVLVAALGAFVTLGAAETATWCIDGPAYPNECRHALKTPTTLLPVAALVSVMTVSAFVAGPLLLAAQEWLWGAITVGIAGLMVFVGTKSLHQLSRRFLVFVPAGFVVHDQMTLMDPVLFRRNVVDTIGPAPVGTDSLDLTLGTAGMPLEVQLHEKVELTKLSKDRKTGEVGRTARFLVSPMRPGAVVREARARRYR